MADWTLQFKASVQLKLECTPCDDQKKYGDASVEEGAVHFALTNRVQMFSSFLY